MRGGLMDVFFVSIWPNIRHHGSWWSFEFEEYFMNAAKYNSRIAWIPSEIPIVMIFKYKKSLLYWLQYFIQIIWTVGLLLLFYFMETLSLWIGDSLITTIDVVITIDSIELSFLLQFLNHCPKFSPMHHFDILLGNYSSFPVDGWRQRKRKAR